MGGMLCFYQAKCDCVTKQLRSSITADPKISQSGKTSRHKSGLTRFGMRSGKGEAAACVGVDCSEAGGGDGVDEGVDGLEAGGSATSSSLLGDCALKTQIKSSVIQN